MFQRFTAARKVRGARRVREALAWLQSECRTDRLQFEEPSHAFTGVVGAVVVSVDDVPRERFVLVLPKIIGVSLRSRFGQVEFDDR